MSEPAEKLDVLVIQFWIHDLSPIAAALRDAEVDARIRRVDIEPAFRAALDRQAWQLVIYDPKAPLSIKLVRSTMRACRCQAFLIIADDPTALGDRIREALWARSC